MARPTITLCMIVKNEERNLPALLKSVEGCFDEIHITDTGSVDSTVDIAEKAGCKIFKFDWIQDFAAARNASISHVQTDYWMWLDGDDVLENREAFIKWRDEAMTMADYWLATYHYTLDEHGNSMCKFARERVMKTDKGYKWKYFLHEGVMPDSAFGPPVASFITSWAVKHMRTEADLNADRSRNLAIFEKNKANLDSRMKYYLGKELFEGKQPLESINYLMEAAKDKDLQPHDRVLALQYACYSYIQLNQMTKALSVAHQGLAIEPHRAEFYCIIADVYLKMHQPHNAIPALNAAKTCIDQNNQTASSPVFTYKTVYTDYPRKQLARIYANIGDLDAAVREAEELVKLYPDEEGKSIVSELAELKAKTNYKDSASLKDTQDIVFSVLPNMAFYDWDWNILQKKGIGGSETACVEMATALKKLNPDSRVIVFNSRQSDDTQEGVEYISNAKMQAYFAENKPKLHIAWRHNLRLTNAKTYLWSHDLFCQHIEYSDRYEKVLALSEFHKRFIQGMFNLPDDKILVTRNGVDTSLFKDLEYVSKRKNKVVYSSSPDRGLDCAIRVVERARELAPELDIELHTYYGFDNMEKMGKTSEVKRFKDMMKAPWIIEHGNLDKKTLLLELSQATVWLYPTYFLETFCITALEALGAGVYPIVRHHGALPDTLRDAVKESYATILDIPCETEDQISQYAESLVQALREERYKLVKRDLSKHSWNEVAKEWQNLLMSESSAKL